MTTRSTPPPAQQDADAAAASCRVAHPQSHERLKEATLDSVAGEEDPGASLDIVMPSAPGKAHAAEADQKELPRKRP